MCLYLVFDHTVVTCGGENNHKSINISDCMTKPEPGHLAITSAVIQRVTSCPIKRSYVIKQQMRKCMLFMLNPLQQANILWLYGFWMHGFYFYTCPHRSHCCSCILNIIHG